MNRLISILILLVPVVLGAPQGIGQPQPHTISEQRDGPNPDGSYSWSYETSNGITATESGQLKNPGVKDLEAMVAQGGFAYTSPEGIRIQTRYVADENGFHAEGDHLPVAPPIPPAIQKALAFLASLPPSARGEQ